jgi:hypothetical protein
MPTLASDLVEETKSHIESGSKIQVDYLNGAIDATTQIVTIQLGSNGFQRGAVIAIDLELMYILADPAGPVGFVKRGWRGSTAATHADDAIVEINPNYSSFAIFRALNQEIASYSSPVHGLYQVKTVDLTYSAARGGYDLTSVTDLIDILEVRWKGYTTGDWPLIRRWAITRDMATSEFASTKALLLYEGVGPGRTIRVRYKAPFAPLTALSSDVQTVSFLPATANDIPPLGAAARLVAPREVRRADYGAQPEPRVAADVPPGSSRNAAGGLLALRNQRLREEATRLHRSYPSMTRSA